MTRRERLERKLEKRQDWSAGAAAKADSAFQRSQDLVKHIPMGQPVLVGHHSERRHRNTLDKSWNALGKSVELSHLAEHHASKAAGLERQLDRNIFSDDADAVEALEQRIAENEAKRDGWKKINAMYRKGDAAGLAAVGLDLERLRESLKTAYSWCQQPHPAYELTNLGARIRGDKERLQDIKTRQARAAAAESSSSGVTREECAEGYVRITFAEKPAREILTALKAAGFFWSRGSWAGKADALPAEVAELLAAGADDEPSVCIAGGPTVESSGQCDDAACVCHPGGGVQLSLL